MPGRGVVKFNLIGMQISRLKVLSYHPVAHGAAKYLCQCSCGSEPKLINASNLIASWRKKRNTSCGCLLQHPIPARIEAKERRLLIARRMYQRRYHLNKKGVRICIICDEPIKNTTNPSARVCQSGVPGEKSACRKKLDRQQSEAAKKRSEQYLKPYVNKDEKERICLGNICTDEYLKTGIPQMFTSTHSGNRICKKCLNAEESVILIRR